MTILRASISLTTLLGQVGGIQFHAHHEPDSADILDLRILGVQFLKPLAEVFADLDDMLEHVILLQRFEKLQGDRARQRATAEGRPVQTGMESLRNRFGRKNRAQRQSGRQWLGDGSDVGKNPIVLIGEHLSRTAKAALDFVEDQRRAGFLGQRPRGFQKLAAGGMDAAFSLHGFNADRAHLGIELLLEIRNIVEAHEADAGHDGREWLAGT